MWLVLRFVLVFPFLVLRVVWRRLRGALPARWGFGFAVVVEVMRYFLTAALGPLLAGRKLPMPSPPLPPGLAKDTDVRPVTLAGRPAEWLTPKGTSPDRCVLYLHGGAFVTGSVGTHRALMARLAHAAQARVVGLDYRLAPEHRFPAGLDDCLAAYEALLAAGERPERLVIAGDSAGGGLTASTLLALKERGRPLPAAAWLISPAVDLADARASWERHETTDYLGPLRSHVDTFAPTYLGPGGDPKAPLASPLYGALAGLPPLLIHVGEREVLHDQVVAFAEAAKAAGVAVTCLEGADMVHVFPAFVGLAAEADEAFVRAGEFVREHTPS